MSAKKRAKWSQQKREFAASLNTPDSALDSDSAYKREAALWARLDEKNKMSREAARQKKACTSKNRYASRKEAEETIAALKSHGVSGLSVYRCEFCDGWHLTSHPWN